MPNDKNNAAQNDTYMAVWPLDDASLPVGFVIAEAQIRLPNMLMRDRVQLLVPQREVVYKIQKGNFRSAFGDVVDVVVTAEAPARRRP
jgi:hypothetical protein